MPIPVRYPDFISPGVLSLSLFLSSSSSSCSSFLLLLLLYFLPPSSFLLPLFLFSPPSPQMARKREGVVTSQPGFSDLFHTDEAAASPPLDMHHQLMKGPSIPIGIFVI